MSVVFHLSLFAIAFIMPEKSGRSGTAYYVDLVQLPGGGGKANLNQQQPKKGGDANQLVQEPETQRMKDLTTQKEEPKSKLRYPDKKKKSKSKVKKKKRPKKKLISVVKKKNNKSKNHTTVTRKTSGPSNVLKTGLSAGGSGSGGGSGGGHGSGYGSGTGSGRGLGSGFQYAYYIESLRGKIANSWYKSVVSPGLRGRFVAGVYFKIMRNGLVRDLELKDKSGVKGLDLSALRAIENASPFAPLPPDYAYSYLGVYFDFVWEKK